MKRLFVLVLVSAFSLTSLACKKKDKKPAPRKTTKTLKRGAPKGEGFSFDAKATKISWTGFKFTEKAAVKGHFATFSATGKKTAKTALELLQGFSLTIDGASVKTGRPDRDANIAANFFKKFVGGPTITARVLKVEGKEKGKLHVELKLSGLTKTVVFDYTLSADGKLVANAGIDMVKFGLKAAYDSIHQACKGFHVGKDKKSVTWTDAKLHLTTQFAKN